MKLALRILSVFMAVSLFWGCGGGDVTSSGNVSSTTGWEYNNPENGGFEVRSAVEQETGPGLVLIEGGTFTMGRV